MKLILYIAFTFVTTTSFGQVAIAFPTIKYVSKWALSDLQPLSVGTKILFSQNCTADVPPQVPNGVVFFDNVNHNGEKFAVAVEFKDTIVESVTYYIAAKQDKLLAELGLFDVNARAASKKGEWTYSCMEGSVFTVVVGNRKTITIVRTRR